MKPFARKSALVAACAALLCTGALAQQNVYPAKGQSPTSRRRTNRPATSGPCSRPGSIQQAGARRPPS